MAEPTILITYDTRMKDGVLHDIDKQVIPDGAQLMTPEEAIEHMKDRPEEVDLTPPEPMQEGWVPVDEDFLNGLRPHAERTLAEAMDVAAPLNMFQAIQIRRWRVDEAYTWRSVAQAYSDRWGGDWGSNQILGMHLCQEAAKQFGEDYMEPPWN